MAQLPKMVFYFSYAEAGNPGDLESRELIYKYDKAKSCGQVKLNILSSYSLKDLCSQIGFSKRFKLVSVHLSREN